MATLPPLLSALFLTGPILKRPVRDALGLTLGVNRYWGTAWLTPILVFLLGLALAYLMTGDAPLSDAASYLEWKRTTMLPERFEEMVSQNPPGHPFWLIIRGLPMSITLNLLIALGLESGLRGFLFREMPGGYWARSLRIGVFAGVYLAPLAIAYFPGQRLAGAGLIFASMVTLSPSLVYFRVRAGSVVPVALYWSLVYTLTRPALEIGANISPLVRPLFGAAGVVANVALLGALYLHDRYVAEQRLMPERARPER